MKTQNRRLIATLCSVVSILITFVFPVKSLGQGTGPNVVNDTVITVTPTLGPVVATQQFINDTTYALQNDLTSFGMFNAIASGSSINITNIFDFGNVGNAIYFTMSISSSTPFTLAQVGYSATSPIFNYSGTLGSAGVTYSGEGFGVDSSGNTFTTGNADTLVTSAYIIGWHYSIDITGHTVEEQLPGWAALEPFKNQVDYSSGNTSGSASVFYKVVQTPEPSTVALSILGVFGLILTLRKGRK